MSPPGEPGGSRLPFHQRVFWLTLGAGLPGTAVALLLLWTGEYSSKTRWTLVLLILLAWWGLATLARQHVAMPLQTLSNLIAALREGDFSIRMRGARRDDPLGEVALELNALTQALRDQRLHELDATTLLRAVMGEIDVAIFAFDSGQRLRLINRAGERLLGRPSERLIGRRAETLELADCLGVVGESRLIQRSFAGGSGRWQARVRDFRQGGLPMRLLVLTDIGRTLREEEQQAWRRLIRVLSHELNNSLTPIQSIAGSLESLLRKTPRPEDWEDDVGRGLNVIAKRSAALARFLDAYARLARLPQPRLAPVELGPLLRRVAGLETRVAVELQPGPGVTVTADADQLEQLLINLVRNAVDAALVTGGGVQAGWDTTEGHVEVWVADEGPGLPDTQNLFVPFFTTKPGGSGIGLVLSQQIAEAHHGTLTVQNRGGAPGCEARLRLPRRAA